jgi:hypothetical protein
VAQLTLGQERIAELPDNLEAASAGTALIFIHRHNDNLLACPTSVRVFIVNKRR